MDRKWKDFGNILEMTTDEKASLYKQYRREFNEEYSDQYYKLETKIKDIYYKWMKFYTVLAMHFYIP